MLDLLFKRNITVEMLDQENGIYLFHNFLSQQECDHLIAAAEPRLVKSTVMSHDNGTSVLSQEVRSSMQTFIPIQSDPIVCRIGDRIAQKLPFPKENGEDLQVVRYQPGQFYRPHFDYFNPDYPGMQETLQQYGQRVCTMLLYLNEPEEGGETVFPQLMITIRPKRGMALLFYNVFSDGHVNEKTQHGGSPVIKGQKWIANKWIREKKYAGWN
jgi:prolyl 4-hydroxylase